MFETRLHPRARAGSTPEMCIQARACPVRLVSVPAATGRLPPGADAGKQAPKSKSDPEKNLSSTQQKKSIPSHDQAANSSLPEQAYS